MATLLDFGVRLKKVILEMLKCISAVTIIAFLELEQIFSFMDGHYLTISGGIYGENQGL